jgi:hypothetical protein
MLVLVMLVRPFVSRVFLFFVVALLACNSLNAEIKLKELRKTASSKRMRGSISGFQLLN